MLPAPAVTVVVSPFADWTVRVGRSSGSLAVNVTVTTSPTFARVGSGLLEAIVMEDSVGARMSPAKKTNEPSVVVVTDALPKTIEKAIAPAVSFAAIVVVAV